jgi:hypothetical protein
MHDPQMLILLAAALAVLCWRIALKLVIGIIAICFIAILAFAALGLGHYLPHLLR